MFAHKLWMLPLVACSHLQMSLVGLGHVNVQNAHTNSSLVWRSGPDSRAQTPLTSSRLNPLNEAAAAAVVVVGWAQKTKHFTHRAYRSNANHTHVPARDDKRPHRRAGRICKVPFSTANWSSARRVSSSRWRMFFLQPLMDFTWKNENFLKQNCALASSRSSCWHTIPREFKNVAILLSCYTLVFLFTLCHCTRKWVLMRNQLEQRNFRWMNIFARRRCIINSSKNYDWLHHKLKRIQKLRRKEENVCRAHELKTRSLLLRRSHIWRDCESHMKTK